MAKSRMRHSKYADWNSMLKLSAQKVSTISYISTPWPLGSFIERLTDYYL